MKKTGTIMVAAIAAIAALGPGLAAADWTGNIGWVSDYYYRGIFQAGSSASGGIDYANGGFYAGTWSADVNDGLEVDGYFGYGREIGDLRLGAGFTGYYYTGDFDDTYQELNLNAGFRLVTLDVALGQYENFAGPTEDYAWYALTVEKNGFHGRFAGFSEDFSGNYFEFGYTKSLAELDLGLTLILADDDLVGDRTESLTFSIGKTFDLD